LWQHILGSGDNNKGDIIMKIIYILYCALIALAAFSAPASAEIVGDANNDNRITAADSVLALQMSVGSVTPDIERADVSGDGRISSLDALMMLMMARKTQVCVNAPEAVSGTFDATIEIYSAADLDSGQFDLWFDSSVVNVTGVSSGSIDGTAVPVGSNWTVMHGTDRWDCDKLVRVVFDMSGVTGVSGSGTLATIHFTVTGASGDTSALAVSDGLLVDTGSDELSAFWFDDLVTVGVPVTVNAPESVSGTFDATIDIADVINLDSGQFDLSFDAGVVNVTGVSEGSIDATEVGLDGWTFTDSDTVRVIFNIPGATGVSGSGSLVTIHFEVTGTSGDTSALAISDGLLVDTESGRMPSVWIDDGVRV
jgi:hypothetical protein